MRRVLVCGDRHWKNADRIRAFIETLPPDALVIHGDCVGADRIAAWEATLLGMPVVAMRAPWEAFAKSAGPIRNQWMLDYLRPDEVHAFHDNIAASKGTKDMLRRAEIAGIPVEVHTTNPPARV